MCDNCAQDGKRATHLVSCYAALNFPSALFLTQDHLYTMSTKYTTVQMNTLLQISWTSEREEKYMHLFHLVVYFRIIA